MIKQKLAIFHVSTATTWRGGEQQIAWLMKGLQRKGITQVLMVPADTPLATWALQEQFTLHAYTKRGGVDWRAARNLASRLRTEGSAIIHLHDSHAHTMGVLAASLFGLNAPMVLARRVDFRPGKNWLTRWKYQHRNLKYILPVSHAIEKILLQIPVKSKIQVIHDGIDPGRFEHVDASELHKTFSISETDKIIGNVAALAAHKDYSTWLRVAEILAKTHSNLKFLIVGADADDATAIRQLATNLPCKDQIIFTGFRKDVPALLQIMDLFLFTSKEEGLGSSLLDAMAAGVPVVCTNAGGIPDIVQHQYNGWMCEKGDVQGLSEGVETLLTNQGLREEFIRNGKMTAQKFHYENMVDKTLKVYESIWIE